MLKLIDLERGSAMLLLLLTMGCNLGSGMVHDNHTGTDTVSDEQFGTDTTSDTAIVQSSDTDTTSHATDGTGATDECSETIIEAPTSEFASQANPYHTCSNAVPTGAKPLIANFENCTIGVAPNENRIGAWYSFNDGTGGALAMEVAAGAAHFSSSNWLSWGSAVGCGIWYDINSPQLCAYDASPYAGVRFRAKGEGRIKLKVTTTANLAIENGGRCDRGENCYDLPMALAILTSEWQSFEIPFCAMSPEGWGGEVSALNPAEIVDFEFFFDAKMHVDFWIDDLSFFTEASANNPLSCEKPCPLDLVLLPEMITPEVAELPLTDELTLHTFDQQTPRCGPIRRRYLRYVPSHLPLNSNAPVLFALNGTNGNAEGFQNFLAHGRFDELATRDGFVVVYGNAAPGQHSSHDPKWGHNSSSWRHGGTDDGEVDDVAYLEMVLDELKTQSVISGNNDVYLVGLSNGGGMVLKAARERPNLFKGIAPFMPYIDEDTVPILSGIGLERVIFGFASADPGLPDGYDTVLAPLPSKWAAALGIPADVIQNPAVTNLPNIVSEGLDYIGDNPIALRTQNSTVTQLDMATPGVPGRLRVLQFNNGGHIWPTPEQDTDMYFIETFGFRNQDVDAADAIWSFFKDSDSAQLDTSQK